MLPLTKRQAEMLAYIREYLSEEGVAPTVRELANRFGLRATNAVADHLRALERKGYLRREDMKSRALKLVADMSPPLAKTAG